jgi:integrase
LRWLDVDFKGGRILLPQTKNGEGRIVYLNQFARQALSPSRLAKPSTDPVFEGPSVTPENVGWLFFGHAVRWVSRIFSSTILSQAECGCTVADIHTVALILGHKDMFLMLFILFGVPDGI